jgi:hypothetical protein
MARQVDRRLRAGLVGLCVLALAGTAQSGLADAAPTANPTTAATSSADAAKSAEPTPSTSTSYQLSPDAFALTVSPARLTVAQDALDDTQQVTVVNRGRQPVTVTVEKRNFTAGADGALSYRPDAPFGAADWVDVSPARLTLDPGVSQQVTATIRVPEEPEPGDHQVALVFLAPPTGSGNIKINRGIGTPVYVTVPGPVDDSVRLKGLSGPRWSWHGQPTLTASLSSTGTVHRDFRGPTALSVGTAQHRSRFADFTVSRGADRVVRTTWDAPLVCVCRPSISVTNGDEPAQVASARVVVLPWWLAAGVLAVALVALLLGIRARRRSRPDATGGDTGQPDPAVIGSG